MGGDRDGNPFVTASVTRQTCLLQRWMAAELYLETISQLRMELSMREGSGELASRVGPSREPYRVLLGEVIDRLEETARWCEGTFRTIETGRHASPVIPGVYTSVEELLEPLLLCWRSLHETGAQRIALGSLLDLIRRVYAFGLSLVRWDIRQDAGRHREAIAAIPPRAARARSYRASSASPRCPRRITSTRTSRSS
jgi:phosphoenolpyruvate carboxylase